MARAASGRPRVSGTSLTGLGTREDILAASAELFCSKGFAGTSTHAIAAKAGIRQASLYHYFRSKQEILLELLIGTVQPSLTAAAEFTRHLDYPPAARLWALCVSDVRLLCSGDHNVGALYLIPELEDSFFEHFHSQRAELEGHYRGLIADCGFDPQESAEGAVFVLALVENVILQRRRDAEPIPTDRQLAIATAGLRVLGLPTEQIEDACERGADLVGLLDAHPGGELAGQARAGMDQQE